MVVLRATVKHCGYSQAADELRAHDRGDLNSASTR